MVEQWKTGTPDNFLFSVKLSKRITHELKLSDVENELGNFENRVSRLGGKLACIVVQLPPFLKYQPANFELVEQFLKVANPEIRYALEFRDKSWLNPDVFAMLRAKRASFVWSVTDRMEDFPAEVTTDFVYLRFMGKFGEFSRLDRIQKDRTSLLERWWEKLSNALPSLKIAYVLVSNHFSGFAPTTVNDFRKIAGLEAVDWQKAMPQE